MKRIALLLMGFFPLLLIGYGLNHLIMTALYYNAVVYLLIGIAVLAVWFAFGMLSAKLTGSKKEAVLLLNAPAFLVLLLILVQELILRAYWMNIIGVATQMFYLPLLPLSFTLARVLPGVLMVGPWLASAIAFALLVGASCLGRRTAESRGK